MKTQIISQFILADMLDLSFKRTSEVCFVLCVIFCFIDEKLKKMMKYMALEKAIRFSWPYLSHITELKVVKLLLPCKMSVAEVEARAPHSYCLSSTYLWISLFRRQDFCSLHTLRSWSFLFSFCAKQMPLATM